MKRRIAVAITYESIIKFLGLSEPCEVQELVQSYTDKMAQKFSVIINTPVGYEIPEGQKIPHVNIDLFLEDLRKSNA